MNKLITILKQRRLWASLCGIISIAIPVFNSEVALDSIMGIIEGLSALATIVLPLWSYLKPKQKNEPVL